MKLTKKQIIFLASALLALIAFFMMFAAQIGVKAGGTPKFKDVFFGGNGVKGAWPVFIAYLLVLLTAVCVLLSVFVVKDPKQARNARLAGAALLVIAAILIFLVKTFWLGMNNVPSAIKSYYKLGIGAILAGVFSLLAAAGLVVGELVIKE